MATDTRLITPDMASDATFRAWMVAVDAALQAVGLVPAADTGQIDFTTAVRPVASLTAAGYKMYRFSDALQATKPVFIKLEFGSGNTSTVAGMWVTAGNGTNGAGTLVGQVGARNRIYAAGAVTPPVATMRTSGDSGRIAMTISGGTYGGLMSVERSHADDGSDTGEAIAVLWKWAAGAVNSGADWIGTPGPVVSMLGIPALIAPVSNTSAVYGTDTGVFPVTIGAGKLRNPCLNFVAAMLADVPSGSEISVPIYGLGRNYRSLGTGDSGNNLTPFGTQINGAPTTTNVIPLQRWE